MHARMPRPMKGSQQHIAMNAQCLRKITEKERSLIVKFNDQYAIVMLLSGAVMLCAWSRRVNLCHAILLLLFKYSHWNVFCCCCCTVSMLRFRLIKNENEINMKVLNQMRNWPRPSNFYIIFIDCLICAEFSLFFFFGRCYHQILRHYKNFRTTLSIGRPFSQNWWNFSLRFVCARNQ